MRTHIFRYGFFYALALCLGFVFSYIVFGNDPENYSKSELLGYSIMLFTSVIVVLAVRATKLAQNGELTFFSGLSVGLGVSALGAMAFAIYNWVYVTWLHPEFLSEYITYHESKIRQSGLTDAVVEQKLGELAAYADIMSSSAVMASIMFATVFVIGALFALCAALTFKTRPD